MTIVHLDSIIAEHAARTAALDPLLPVPAPLSGELIIAGGAAAAAKYQEIPEGLAMRTWQAARTHRLTVRLAGPDHAADLGAVLDRWLAGLHPAGPGDLDCAAMVELPSRDTEAVLALLRRGFAPVSVLAARRARPEPLAAGVRPATVDDLPAALALDLELVEYDARFGKITPRSDTAEALEGALRHRFTAAPPQSWVAERDGELVGLAAIQLLPEANWVAGHTSAPVFGYLETMAVAEEHRGCGVGAALLTRAHAALDAAAPVSLLHHAVPNPLSTPFWYRNGYRPLWTMWQRRPAIPAG